MALKYRSGMNEAWHVKISIVVQRATFQVIAPYYFRLAKRPGLGDAGWPYALTKNDLAVPLNGFWRQQFPPRPLLQPTPGTYI